MILISFVVVPGIVKGACAWFFGLGLVVFAAACGGATSNPTPGTGGTTGAAGNGSGGASGCASHQTLCSNQCVDTSSDLNNCGGCDLPCGSGRICQNSQCGCQPGLLDCNDACLPSDSAHCGNCTTTCQATEICSNNVCSHDCPMGLQFCGPTCCGSNQTCTNDACVDSTAGTGGAAGTTGAGGG
jgi:hypothetical protein